MKIRNGILVALAAICFSGIAAYAQEAGSDIVIFGANSVWLKQNSEIFAGDVVAARLGQSGGTLACSGREVCVGIGHTSAGNLAGDDIKLKTGSLVSGDVLYNGLLNNGTILGEEITPIDPERNPLPASQLPPFQTANPSTNDITVGIGGSTQLAAGSYGILKVKKNGTVIFEGGVYDFEEIDGGISVDLLFDAPSTVRVDGKFKVQQNSMVVPSGVDPEMTAADIVFYVAGVNGNNGNLGATPKAAKIGLSSLAEANFHVPNGTLWIRQNADVEGAFVGRDVILGIGATALLTSAFDFVNPPPTADDQQVLTSGTTSLAITLTGSDPDNEPLTFSILVTPAQGDLTGTPPDLIYTANTNDDFEDLLVFRVTDPAGGFDDGIVDINPGNPGGPEPGPDPPTFTNTVIGIDDSAEGIIGVPIEIILSGFADVPDPGAVGDFVFSIVTGPTKGALSGLTQIPPTSAAVTYTAASPGTDSFVFQVCGDLDGNGDTLGEFECDTATISISNDDEEPPPPPVAPSAEDLTVTTPEETPVEINLSDQNEDCSVPGPNCEHPSIIWTPPGGGGVTLAGGPNLTVTIFNAPSCALHGEVIGGQIQVRVTNTGPAVIPAATAAAIGFYVSTDSVITTSDTLMIGGRENLLSEAPGGLLVGEFIENFLFTGASINTGSPTGNVFIGVLADEFDALDEDNEGDNTAAQAIEILASGTCSTAPDLVISSITHSPLEPTGFGEMTFTAIVKNDGEADAAASTLCFAIDALGEDCNSTAALFAVPLLAPGATHTEVRTEDIAVGTGFQNTAVADIGGVVAESDEQNNSATDTFGVGTPGTLMTATITALPTKGTVSGITATSNGLFVAITTPTDLTDTMVSYTSDPLPVGVTEATDSFAYTLTDTSTGLTSIDPGIVDVTITQVIDECLANGREFGCSPGQ